MKKKFKLLVITPIKKINLLKQKLKKNATVKIITDPTENYLKEIIHNYDIVFTNPNKSKIFFGKNLIELAKKLKVLCTASTGTTHIDKKILREKKIKLISLTKEYQVLKKISSTSELALSFTLLSIRNILNAHQDVIKNNNWDYENFISNQFSNLNIGILGLGRLGKIYANFTHKLGFKIFYYDPYVDLGKKHKYKKINSMKKLFLISDVVSIHLHVNENTSKIINKSNLKFLKENVKIINTSRGELINEKDLINFLKKNKKSIYCTDVISNETNGPVNNLLVKYSKNNDNVIITPHIGGMTKEAQEIAYNHSADLLNKYIESYLL